MGETEAAIGLLEAALERAPAEPGLWIELAEARRALGQPARAMACQEEAIRLAPGHRVAHERLGMLRLHGGDFSRAAWQHYAWHQVMDVERGSAIRAPVWDGSALAGKSVALLAHQALGDQILFASCVPDVVAAAGRTLLFCEPRLAALFRRSFPRAEVNAVPPPAVLDFQAALGRLPMYLRNAPGQFPGTPYLFADAARVAAWRGRLERLGAGPKIGISWRGGDPQRSGRRRSIPLEQWEPLLRVRGAHFVSLQYGEHAEEMARSREAAGVPLHHWPEAIDDYDETAALASALDLVVSVTTSLVHLAGALGRPTLALVDSQPQWRYLERGERMPWYGSLRLLRQQQPGRWGEPLEAARAEVQKMGTDPIFRSAK